MCDLFLTSRCARILYTKFFDLLSWLAAFDTFDFCLGVGCCWFVLFLAWMGCLLVLSGDGYIQGVIEVSFIFWRLGYRSGSAWTKKKNLKPDQQCGTRHWSRGPQPQPQQTWGRFHRWSEPSYSKKSKILFF